MPYVLEIMTSKASPIAASQAVKTRRMIGAMLARVKCKFRVVRVVKINRDSAMPSKQSSADIRWDRYISRPTRDMEKAIMTFM